MFKIHNIKIWKNKLNGQKFIKNSFNGELLDLLF